MALSTDEENKVREIIEAFTNGKRLSDLPNVSGNNPFNLLCEVLEDGESKKAGKKFFDTDGNEIDVKDTADMA